MKLEAFSVRGCQLAPDCQVNWENVALMNQFVVYTVAGVTGAIVMIVLVVYVVRGVHKVVAKGRQLIGQKLHAGLSEMRGVMSDTTKEIRVHELTTTRFAIACLGRGCCRSR